MSASTRCAAAAAAEALAQQLAVPERLPAGQCWRAQSLTKGAAGIALLHIERAHAGAGSWRSAHTWVSEAAGAEISAADDTGLHFGAPALSFTLHAAGADGTARYGSALAGIDTHVTALTHRRVDLAQARIDRGDSPAFAEYDLLHGLTGIGAHLLHHAPGGDALGRVLSYLVRLTTPLRTDGETLPGWWVSHDPHVTQSGDFPGGHANLGIAHGIALRTGRPNPQRPLRPSWCYGTPGLARAQQLVAIATSDAKRQGMAEHALAGCLSDPVQLGRITDTSLCHGWAGLYQSVWRAARDALAPEIGASLPHLAEVLVRHCRASQSEGTGLLEGDAGLALALHTAAHTAPPISEWDACLLIN